EEFFEKVYKDEFQHAKKHNLQMDKLDESERFFYFRWLTPDPVDELKIPRLKEKEVPLSENTIKFKKVVAQIEYSKKKITGDDKKILLKQDRLNIANIETIFFEKDNQVFVLILTSDVNHLRRVKKLIGESLDETGNLNYNLSPELFNWLIYTYEEHKGILNTNITLKNINGFVGNVTDEANIFTGTSYQTTELIVTKAFISNGGQLRKISMRIEDDDVNVSYFVNEDSTIILDLRDSSKKRLLDNLDDQTFLLLYLYGYLILKVKNIYLDCSVKFINEEKPNFSKKIGIEVIQSIMKNNEIMLDEITKNDRLGEFVY
ncbi:hypothetical protein KAR50_09430, partial [Periweissella fabaria]